MTNFIEELFFRNLRPQTSCAEKEYVLQHISGQLSLQEEILMNTLHGEEKERFIKYVNLRDDLMGESTTDKFIVGFRMGARFAVDTFTGGEEMLIDHTE